jgi:predicted Holliday junction resolvase-like endonuclease
MIILDILIPNEVLIFSLIVIAAIFLTLWSSYKKEKQLKEKNWETIQAQINIIREKELIFQKNEADAKFNAHVQAARELDKWKEIELGTLRKTIEDNALKAAANLLTEWKQSEGDKMRKDAITKSVSVHLGKITEHLIPFSKDFKFNPRDARFIGSPIDLIVFDGCADNKEEITIYFLEIKTGTSQLSAIQKKIKDCVLNKRIEWIPITIKNFET